MTKKPFKRAKREARTDLVGTVVITVVLRARDPKKRQHQNVKANLMKVFSVKENRVSTVARAIEQALFEENDGGG